jgi:hypothetical protein
MFELPFLFQTVLVSKQSNSIWFSIIVDFTAIGLVKLRCF